MLICFTSYPSGLVLIYFCKGLFEYLQAYLMGYVGQKVITDIRNLVFNCLQRQPLSFFDKTPTGVSISRIINDVSLVQSTVSDAFTAIIKDAFSIIVTCFCCFLQGLETRYNRLDYFAIFSISYHRLRKETAEDKYYYSENHCSVNELSP